MTDGPYFNNTLKGVITITALLFNAAIVLYCILEGKPDNSLHSSAMAWAFMMGAGILVGLGIGSITPTITDAFMKKAP